MLEQVANIRDVVRVLESEGLVSHIVTRNNIQSISFSKHISASLTAAFRNSIILQLICCNSANQLRTSARNISRCTRFAPQLN